MKLIYNYVITKFKIFENNFPDVNKDTIRAEITGSEHYIDFYFDGNILVAIDNNADYRFPFKVPYDLGENKFRTISLWAYNHHTYSHTRFKVYYILEEEAKKYNI